ncbi:MAG: hypothetical protein DRP08_06265 [Candidatus Aenigmatarchaeota archaeon]|nr:MAG: hypothetical protein DRP08_06265 [Candidatus Aenigmarchaeota archaeon]
MKKLDIEKYLKLPELEFDASFIEKYAPERFYDVPDKLEIYFAVGKPIIIGINYLYPFYDWRKFSQTKRAEIRKVSRKIFLDSGLLAIHDRDELWEYLELQEEAVETANADKIDRVTMFDIPIVEPLKKRLEMDAHQLFDLHLRMSEKFRDIKSEHSQKVWVIQGDRLELTLENIRAIKDWVKPKDAVALGGVARGYLPAKLSSYVWETLEAMRDAFPKNEIHLFGVFRPDIIAMAYLKGLINSCDAVSPKVWGDYYTFEFGIEGKKRGLDPFFGSKRVTLRPAHAFHSLAIGSIFLIIQRAITDLREAMQYKLSLKEVIHDAENLY